MKENVRYRQKPIFSIKKYLLIQSMISSCSKISKRPWWSPLFKIKINAIQNHWMTINVIGGPPRRRLFLVLHVWSCFWHIPASTSLLWLVPRSFIFFQATASHNVLTYKLTMNQLHVDFITKHCQGHYKVGQLKVGQVLQIGTGITKRGNFYLKVGQ